MILQKLHNTFSRYVFYEKGHIYIDTKTGKRLPSVTRRIKQYTKPFNQEFWTTYKALQRAGHEVKKKYGDETGMFVNGEWLNIREAVKAAEALSEVKPFQIGMEWDAMASQGRGKGTKLHHYIESAIYGKRNDSELHRMVDEWVDKDYIKGKFIPVKMEVIVGNGKICGMLDNLSLLTRRLYLRDYKTDKKFRRENPWQNLLPPLDHLQDCEFNKYSLQTSMYRIILEREAGVKVDVQQAIHFRDGVEVIELEWMKDEAEFLCYGDH